MCFSSHIVPNVCLHISFTTIVLAYPMQHEVIYVRHTVRTTGLGSRGADDEWLTHGLPGTMVVCVDQHLQDN